MKCKLFDKKFVSSLWLTLHFVGCLYAADSNKAPLQQTEHSTCASQDLILFQDYDPLQACLHRLAELEKQTYDQEGSKKFVYRPFLEWYHGQKYRFPMDNAEQSIKEWIESIGFGDYRVYLFALAKSEILTDEQKISEGFFQGLPVDTLYRQPQEKREKLLEKLHDNMGSDRNYPLRRIFSALFYRSGIQLEKEYKYSYGYPLTEALIHNDIPLVKLLLKHGANANGHEYDTLRLAKELDIIHLLKSYGADIKHQQAKHDLVRNACMQPNYDIFYFFLKHTDEYHFHLRGESWFQAIWFGVDYPLDMKNFDEQLLAMPAKIEQLLRRGCYCNASDEHELMKVAVVLDGEIDRLAHVLGGMLFQSDDAGPEHPNAV